MCDGLDNDCDGGMDNIDQDGDGYTLCTTGGDCDDRNANAHPVLVDINAENDGDGSVETPFRDLDEAIANIDNVCRTIALLPGTYNVQMDWDDGPLYFVGAGNIGAVTFELGVDEDEEQLTGRCLRSRMVRCWGSRTSPSGWHRCRDGGAIRRSMPTSSLTVLSCSTTPPPATVVPLR